MDPNISPTRRERLQGAITMHYDRRELNILTWNENQMRDAAIANAFMSVWRGSKFVITRLAAFTANRMRAVSTYVGRRLRHE